MLQISDQKGILFNGKMKDFNKLEPRFIAKNGSEQLFLKIVVPEELGNDFQGLGSEVEFKFYVEGTLGGFCQLMVLNYLTLVQILLISFWVEPFYWL